MKRKTEHWAYEELRKRLEEKTETWTPLQDAGEPQIRRITKYVDHELGTVFLMDPQARNEIDEAVLERIYPHILETVEGGPLNIPSISEIQQEISYGRNIEASRVVTFLMTDPTRPVGTNERPLWYFRFTLEVRLLSYMLSSDCLLSIPFPAAGSWLLDVLADTRLQDLPPSLSADSHAFVLSISSGAGKSYLQDDWKRPVSALFTGHIRIAEYVDRFEDDPLNYVRRSEMIEAIAMTYQRVTQADT
jgi:hypothetical protein